MNIFSNFLNSFKSKKVDDIKSSQGLAKTLQEPSETVSTTGLTEGAKDTAAKATEILNQSTILEQFLDQTLTEQEFINLIHNMSLADKQRLIGEIQQYIEDLEKSSENLINKPEYILLKQQKELDGSLRQVLGPILSEMVTRGNRIKIIDQEVLRVGANKFERKDEIPCELENVKYGDDIPHERLDKTMIRRGKSGGYISLKDIILQFKGLIEQYNGGIKVYPTSFDDSLRLIRDFYRNKSKEIGVNKLIQDHYIQEKSLLDRLAIDLTVDVLHKLQNNEIDQIKFPQ